MSWKSRFGTSRLRIVMACTQFSWTLSVPTLNLVQRGRDNGRNRKIFEENSFSIIIRIKLVNLTGSVSYFYPNCAIKGFDWPIFSVQIWPNVRKQRLHGAIINDRTKAQCLKTLLSHIAIKSDLARSIITALCFPWAVVKIAPSGSVNKQGYNLYY